MKTVYERVTERFGPTLPWLIAVLAASGFAFASAAHADDRSGDKTVSCSSDDGRRKECDADLRGYSLRDVDQASRTDCVVGRNWGYDERGVWVTEGCRATFHFDRTRDGDRRHPYAWRDRDDDHDYDTADERRIRCESKDSRRTTCDADLRGYRLADLKEISHADCDIGRNFGYDDRGVWVEQGCRGDFIFTRDRGRYSDRDRDFDRR
ncbi:MAG TPA: DUF3011 domain-containing protein [Steroidobacteraceae bacterium]|jgi:hypothetical protein|nr:DUF3011 domain-containing protein [Steroidobacteraceae bacterium]